MINYDSLLYSMIEALFVAKNNKSLPVEANSFCFIHMNLFVFFNTHSKHKWIYRNYSHKCPWAINFFQFLFFQWWIFIEYFEKFFFYIEKSSRSKRCKWFPKFLMWNAFKISFEYLMTTGNIWILFVFPYLLPKQIKNKKQKKSGKNRKYNNIE